MELLGLDILKSLIIIVIVLLYWKFVYYKYHTKLFTPISFVLYGGSAALLGFYSLFITKIVSFSDYDWLFYPFALIALISFSMVSIGWKKHGLVRGVDITLNWTDKLFGRPFVYLAMIISFPVFFFAMAGSYVLLGNEHVVLWAMIILAWIRSDIILYKKEIAK